MKTIKFLSIVALSSLLFSCSGNKADNNTSDEKSENQETVKSNEPIKDYLAIYDFHNEHRCVTCVAIEDATKEILNKYFQKEMDDGIITFDLYNCEAEENQDLVEEYGAFGTTLAFTVFKDGEKLEVRDLTNWAFKTINTKDFEPGIKDEIQASLDKLK
jgi:thiol-disulfide isomerase/thioredoxin